MVESVEGSAPAFPGAAAAVRILTIAVLALTVLVGGCGPTGAEQAEAQAPPPPAPAPAPAPAPQDKPFAPADIQAALQALGEAEAQGFAPGAFGDVQQITQLVQSADPRQQSEGQRQLRRAVLAYARAEHGHGLDEAQFPRAWGLRPPPYDADAELKAAQDQGRLADWLRSLPPPDPGYQALVEALAAYRKIADQGGWPVVGEGGRRALRRRLAAEDPELTADPGEGGPSEDLTDAIKRFQTRYDLKPTGALDEATIEAMNVPVTARIDQIRVNLERWRWAPRDLPATRVEVNIPSFSLDYYQDGQVAMHMLAAAGKVHDQTPMLASTITRVEFNPPWLIPADIARKELYPKEARDRGYFARAHIVHHASVSAPLMQEAGPKSALGRVKFEFLNDYGVYLHDTPTKSSFDLHQRSVSHGCVRLQHAIDLAKALLETTPGWSDDRIDDVLDTTVTQTVTLAQPVPVMLMYWTAYVQDGQTYFMPDPYSWDPILLRLLDAQGSSHG